MMRLRHVTLLAFAMLFAFVGAGAGAATRAWHGAIKLTTDGSHLIGKPDAQVKLVEYISYVCSHCAEFEVAASDAMRLAWVTPGKLSIEIRHFMFNQIDATVAQLVNCGPPTKFVGNHTLFLRTQQTWISRQQDLTRAQEERWNIGDNVSRRRAIASDLKLYDMMIGRGYDRATLDRCLADEPLARRLAAQTAAARAEGIDSTPSFRIDGILLAGTSTWRMLEPQLRARM